MEHSRPGWSRYRVIGLMSGTSLDGLDIALVEFQHRKPRIEWELVAAETVPYPSGLTDKLERCMQLDKVSVENLDHELGHFFGTSAKQFMHKHALSADLVASHGHTVFHQPEDGLTLQIGRGSVIANLTGIPVVSDFRSEDVRKGGQGAPLVPIGDRDLFYPYTWCLNLGGIANISHDVDGVRKAYDIVPCNMVLNTLASELGQPFDRNGDLARSGVLHHDLLAALNAKEYFRKPPPKSLGREWVMLEVFSMLKTFDIPVRDKLHTYVMHISEQIASCINRRGVGHEVLVTGGGARNDFLISQLKNNCLPAIVIPDDSLVDFKEAIVFAYLGLLRYLGKTNVLSSVTGATGDSCSGELTIPGSGKQGFSGDETTLK